MIPYARQYNRYSKKEGAGTRACPACRGSLMQLLSCGVPVKILYTKSDEGRNVTTQHGGVLREIASCDDVTLMKVTLCPER